MNYQKLIIQINYKILIHRPIILLLIIVLLIDNTKFLIILDLLPQFHLPPRLCKLPQFLKLQE